jgi:HSP20 family protein
MAAQTSKTNEQQNQPSKGQEVTRGSRQQGGSSRRSGYGLALPLTPAGFFRMNPFSIMRRMSEEFDRIFGGPDFEQGEGVWVPAIEVTQRDNNLVVRAELPGLNRDHVKVEINDGAIVIQGERKREHEEAKGGVRVNERHYGRFYRAIPLPESVKADEARARFENGVLEITVPVEEQEKSREIPIQESSPGAPSEKAA